MYTLSLFFNGRRKLVTVDDYVPCFPGENSQGGPLCSNSVQDELWVLLLEKALAKCCGSYCNLLNRTSLDFLIDFCGGPFIIWGDPGGTPLSENKQYLPEIPQSILWTQIRQYAEDNKCCIVAYSASIPHNSSNGLLMNGVVYNVLRAVETSSDRRLINLSCPFNQPTFEWVGNWSDGSHLWTPELEFEIGIDDDQSRSFWIEYHDFLTLFSRLCVCFFYESDSHDVRRCVWLQHSPTNLSASAMFALKVDAEAEVHFSVHREIIGPQRCGDNSDSGMLSADSDYGIAILRLTEEGALDHVCSCDLTSQRGSVRSVLRPGRYLVSPLAYICPPPTLTEQHVAPPINPTTNILDQQRLRFSVEMCRVFEEIFDRLDVNMDGVGRYE
jgi:hypothetical protein